MPTRELTYRDGDLTLKGWLATPTNAAGPRPGILVMPEAFGLGPQAKRRAEALAELGYVALAGDPWGDGKLFTDLNQAIAALTALSASPAAYRQRARVALDALAALPEVDGTRLGAMGYCMGGTFSLELARDGAPLRGAVSFHGGLQTQAPAQKGAVKAKVLVLHGADDPMIDRNAVNGFIDEMNAAGANWELAQYGGTVHSFTNPDADGTMSPGIKYNAQADARSWNAMKGFWGEVFG